MSDRLISENAVKALVNGKIDGLYEKIARAVANPTEQTPELLSQYHAQIGALRTVISHLRFIEAA